MDEFLDRLTRYLVCLARAAEPEIDAVLDPASDRGIYAHDNHANSAHVFLALYLTERPANPYVRAPGAADAYRRLVDGWLGKWEASLEGGPPYRFPEWCNFIMARGLERLGDELDVAMRDRMRRVLVHFIEADLPRPFFFTAPNHEIWKLVVAYLAGRLFDRRDWCEQAVFEAEQMVAWQTAEGFWEEGRHHGPSMSYNYTMLGGLTVLAATSASATLRRAAARLARFLGRWGFPDGTTVGAFDGRRPTVPGRACPGMELSPESLTYMQRGLEAWDRRGWLDRENIDGPVFRQRTADWIAAEALFYYTAVGPACCAGPLPVDADGTTLEHHTPTFDATMIRRGPWVVALSSQLSDVPKDTQFIYRLERQSRIEVWHERGSVVLGGGHSLVTAEQPLYNAWVEPGYDAEPEGYSKTNDDAGSPAMARRRSKYYPRAACSGVERGAAWLELVFAHATVRFALEAFDTELVIRYTYEARGVEQLRVALPMLLWEDARAVADARPLTLSEQPAEVAVERQVAVEAPLFGATVILSVPAPGRTRVLYPAAPARRYRGHHGNEVPEGFFTLAFVETVLDGPGRSGSGEWRLRVQ